jgi:hypothetical protein
MNNIKSQRNALLYVHISTHFKEIVRVARLMKNSDMYEPFIFFDVKYEGVEHHIAQCEHEGIQYISYFDSAEFVKIKLWFRIVRRLYITFLSFLEVVKYLLIPFVFLFKLSHIFFRKIFKKRKSYSRFKSHKQLPHILLSCYKFVWNKAPFLLPALSRLAYRYCQKIPKILKEYDIKLMVFPEHNLFYFTQLFVYLGKQTNVSSIIVPFTIANTLEWAVAFYKEKSRSLDNLYNKICARAFPHWVHTYKDRQLLLPIELVLFHEMLHITPKNPWLLNSGDIHFLALESNGMKDYYISAGIEEKHLRATGALYNDELYLKLQNLDSNRTALYQSLYIKHEKPLILCALPPNQCIGREGDLEFSNYEEIVRFIMTELSKYTDDYNIIINLHPRINPNSVEYIADYPVTIFKGDIAEVIPLSSIYIATCSATIRMAISCGIPVINYDLYRYRYDDYSNMDGVLTLFERDEFSTRLEQLSLNTAFYEQIKSYQILNSNKWGTLDGKAGQNLLAEIDLLFA